MGKNISFYWEFINPKRFMEYSNKLQNISLFISLALFIPGFVLGFILAPTDFQQGDNYRIIYVHVPSAWMALLLYVTVALSGFFYLLSKHPFFGLLLTSGYKVGCLFTLITLVTGSLWGVPMWGTYWVWDARLTSVLILFIIYISGLVLLSTFKDRSKALTSASVLSIIGIINIPIIKYSVDWWYTLHQPASITQMGSSIHIDMLIPLFMIVFSFMFYGIFLLVLGVRSQITDIYISNINSKL